MFLSYVNRDVRDDDISLTILYWKLVMRMFEVWTIDFPMLCGTIDVYVYFTVGI